MNVLTARPPRALLLDAGNTLVFLDEAAVAEAAGEDIEPVRITQSLGPAIRRYEADLARGASHEDGWNTYMRVLLTESGVSQDAVDRALTKVRAAHDERNLWRRVGAGVPEALDALAGLGVRLAVVSNSEGSIEALLEEVGLAPRFEIIVDSAVVGVRKPDPRIFQPALKALAVDPNDAVYVGDVPRVDVEGARASGMGAILIDAHGIYPAFTDAPRITSLSELADAWIR